MKLRKIVLLLLLLTPSFTILYSASAQDIVQVEDLSDILEHIYSIDINYTSDDETGHFSYNVLGEETVDGNPAWKIEATFGEYEDEQSLTIWVDKNTGRTIKADIEGQTFTGSLAEVYGNATLGFFTGFIYAYWNQWTYQEILEYRGTEYGTVTPLGSKTQTFGPTPLKSWGVRYEGLVPNEQNIRYDLEVWYAPTDFGGVMTYMSITVTEQEEHDVEIELQSIELVDEQTIPSDFETLMEETEPETEPEEEPETEQETEPEEAQDESGGIPGYPIHLITAGIIIFLMFFKRKKI